MNQSTKPVDALVLFGATGDLAFKKILPALATLAGQGRLTMPVVGIGREHWSAEQFKDRIRDSVIAHGDDAEQEHLELLYRQVHCVGGDYRYAATFENLKAMLWDRLSTRCTTWPFRPASLAWLYSTCKPQVVREEHASSSKNRSAAT